MRRSLASAGLALALALGCASRPPVSAPLPELVHADAPPTAPLPDDLERTAGRFAARVLAGRPDSAANLLERMHELERARRARGAPPSGLLDDAEELFASQLERPAYLEHAEQTLDRGGVDRKLERRLQRELASEPLALAERKISQDRRRKYGSVVNRLTRPAAQLALTASANPIESGSAALASLLTIHGFPEATVEERQALRAWQEFLDRTPDHPEAPRVVERVERYRHQWRLQVHGQALAAAERARDVGRPDVALAHLDRAERVLPGDPDAARLRASAEATLLNRTAEVRRALGARALVGAPLPEGAAPTFANLAAFAIAAPIGDLERRLPEPGSLPEGLSDELAYLRALARRDPRDETPYFEDLERLAEPGALHSNMARHALWSLADPTQNPYRALRAARSADRSQRIGWVMLGSRAHGPLDRNLPRPLEWLLDLPGTAVTLLTFPIRLLQYPTVSPRFGGPVLNAGEQYLARFPEGVHAEDVHGELESLYARRGQWSRALEHHRARSDSEPKVVARYREHIAERTLRAARGERRNDVRVAIYRSIITEYADTSQAETARTELRALIRDYSPQRIRLSREFLEESPRLWGPGALGLRPELFDGEAQNGELADGGILLIGRNLVRLELKDAEPAVREIPEADFARFVALLEEETYERLVADNRESPDFDPQRDLFFERARLGLLQRTDVRPSATSEAEFLSTGEKYGVMRRGESPLPVELVLQGGLEDFGFAAFPRIKLPRRSPDAFLYE